MKFYLATLATTLLVGLTGGLLHAQAPYNCGPQGQDNCGQCGQCGQVYLVVTPSHRLFDPSCRYLFGSNCVHGFRSNENCGCCEPQCSQPCCNEPCHQQQHCEPCHQQQHCEPCYAQQQHCNEGHCNEGHCGRPWSMCYPVKVVQSCGCQYQGCGYQGCGYQGCGCGYQGCSNQGCGYQGCGNRCQGQSCGQQAPCYPNPAYNQGSGGPGYYGQPYGPGGTLPNGPVTTAEPPQAEGSAYVPLVQAIQAAQDKDNRALQAMMENRQATLAVVRAIQSSDQNTVATFEKMLQQMKSNGPAPAPAHPGSSEAPMPGAKDATFVTGGDAATLSLLRQVTQDLDEMSRKVDGLSAEVVTKDNGK